MSLGIDNWEEDRHDIKKQKTENKGGKETLKNKFFWQKRGKTVITRTGIHFKTIEEDDKIALNLSEL